MPRQIFAVAGLKALLEHGAQLVDVMPADEYAQDHLPGAINIPLRQLNAETAAGLDKDRPVVLYCNDFA
jgi:rhodanese-related sulfurtransferase